VNEFHLDLKFPPVGLVQVWVVSLATVRTQLDWLRTVLSWDEEQRAARFVFERDQQRFVLARGILRVLLGGYLNREPGRIAFQYGAHGKPALAREESNPPELRFNVSHSGEYWVCAVSLRRDVGVDIEMVRSDIECLSLAERFFSRREYEDVRWGSEEERRARFFRYWTCKEAYLKARGVGISSGLAQIEMTFNADGSVRCETKGDSTIQGSDCLVRPISIGDHVAAAVAAEGDDWDAAVSNYPVK
jgi:4'-phosphopantetheinyl transferase